MGTVIFMNGKICCFCGHREILDAGIEKRIKPALTELIRDGFTEFYSGGMGEFDRMCERAVRALKRDAKEKHAMRYTQYRGLEKVKAEATLRFACMNLKKLAKWKRIKGLLKPFTREFIRIFAKMIQKTVATMDLQPFLSTV